MKNALNSLKRPQSVINAVSIICISYIFGLAVTLFNWDVITEIGLQGIPEKSPLDYQFLAQIHITSMIVTFIFLAWITYKIYTGRNWARLLYIGMSILGIPITIYTLLDKLHGYDSMVLSSIFTTALNIVTVVILLSKPSREWFQHIKRAKASNNSPNEKK